MATFSNSSNELKSPQQVLHDGAKTYEERNAKYGDNFRTFPSIMMGMFPNGIQLSSYDDWMRMQFLSLIAVKLSRYALNFEAGGHPDSSHDMMVYAAMMESADAEIAHLNSNRQPKTTNEDRGHPGPNAG